MKITIRTDASLHIGTGHIIRCLTLAKTLRQRGAECQFICRDHQGNLFEKIRQDGFNTIVLSHENETPQESEPHELKLAHADWLGSTWQTDAEQTIEALRGKSPEWLIVDHYALDKRWEEKLRPHAKKIMVIDDLADRDHECDLLLDQNLVAELDSRYQKLVPEYCTTLLGPKYALLQPEYAELHAHTPPRIGPVKRILVYFGGADQHNITGLALAAFIKLKRDDIALDVVISSQSAHAAGIGSVAQQRTNFTVHEGLPTLAHLMLNADLAIGAGGATSWERCCLGLPSLVISLAENQKPIAEELHRHGLVHYLGHYDTVNENDLIGTLQAVIEDQYLKDLSRTSISLIDGLGVGRVTSVLILDSENKLNARLARLDDEELILGWANDPLVRANAFNPDPVSAETRRKWFYSRLRDRKNRKIYIAETEDGLPVGQVRFDLRDEGWTIDYSLDRFARGIGLGKRLLETTLYEFRLNQNERTLFARVKQSNARSMSIFESLGFEKKVGGGNLSITVCSDRDSWINSSISALLLEWIAKGHDCSWTHDAHQLVQGDLCFYLSYGKIVNQKTLNMFKNSLVVHESDLPKGKGWSPLSWQILGGSDRIPVTLIEADNRVDRGIIYDQLWLDFEGHELVDELRISQARATQHLCRRFVDTYPESLAKAKIQIGEESFYPRRSPVDSKLDLSKSIEEHFNLLRIVDNERYPAFFEHRGRRYKVSVEAVE